MKKLLCLMFLFSLSNYGFAGIIAPTDDALQDDFGFSLEDQSQRFEERRELASEVETNESSKTEDSSEDSKRDIASDVVESSDSKMMYWKY